MYLLDTNVCIRYSCVNGARAACSLCGLADRAPFLFIRGAPEARGVSCVNSRGLRGLSRIKSCKIRAIRGISFLVVSFAHDVSFVDCEDMFRERLHPAGDGRYRFRDGWRQGQVIEEEIIIRRRPSHTERVVITRHGPLIHHLLRSEKPIALNSVALRPDAAMDGFRLLNTANDWDEFVTAVSRIPAPSLNLIYADADDNIGYYVSGRVPIRQKGDGALPVPGWTGEYEITRQLLSPHFDAPFLHELLGQGINPFLHPTNEFSGNWTAVLLAVLADESHWLYEGRGARPLSRQH